MVTEKRYKEAVLSKLLIVCYLFHNVTVVFRQAEDFSAALEACEGWGCWQQAFVLSAELHQSEGQRVALARRMADKLKQKRYYRDAAHLLSQYADDTEEAIVVLLEGGAWADALCMVSITIIHLALPIV